MAESSDNEPLDLVLIKMAVILTVGVTMVVADMRIVSVAWSRSPGGLATALGIGS